MSKNNSKPETLEEALAKSAPDPAKEALLATVAESENAPSLTVMQQYQIVRQARLREGTKKIVEIMKEYGLEIQSRQSVVNGIPQPVEFFFILKEEA